MPSLHEVQRAMRASLVVQDDVSRRHVVAPNSLRARASRRLSQHVRRQSRQRLRLSFPAVHRLVGEEFFEGAARLFAHNIHRALPARRVRRRVSRRFCGTLRRPRGFAYLPDVARLEWAVNRALHAPDVHPLDARLPALIRGHERLAFVAHPSLSLLRADYPADTIWRAVLDRTMTALRPSILAAGPVLAAGRARGYRR